MTNIFAALGVLLCFLQTAESGRQLENLVSYMRLDAAILNTKGSDSDTYECFVKYADKARGHSRLNVYRNKDNKPFIIFDPSYNSLIKIFSQDVTNDGQIELVSEWTHGNAFQLAIHALHPTPKLIFLKSYRYGMSICLDSNLNTRIKIFSGSGIGKKIIVEEYIWSQNKGEFVLARGALATGHVY
jgi:hypothetical protein